MKKLLFIIALTFTTAGVFAAKTTVRTDDVKKVSNSAIKQFEEDFKSAKDVYWRVSKEYIKANFSLEGKKMAALYNLQGTYLGAVEYLEFEQIPAKAKADIEKQFSKYSFTSALKIVARPDGSDLNDVGTTWVNLSSNVKELFVSISPNLRIALERTAAVITTAQN